MPRHDNASHPTRAIINGTTLDDAAIRGIELTRARRVLADLKSKIGNDAMRVLLKDDLSRSAARVRGWVDASGGAWKSGTVELVVPGPVAHASHTWFLETMKHDRQVELRAAHPEHFLNRPLGPHAEVTENIGHDGDPWHIMLNFTSPDAEFPTAWDPAYPACERLGAIINDAEGRRIGSAIHEMRDCEDGLHIKLTIHLPETAPDELVTGHLHHFAVEFSNWTRMELETA